MAETITKDSLADEAVDALGSIEDVTMARRVERAYEARAAALDLLPDGWTVERYDEGEGIEYGIRAPDDGDGLSVARRTRDCVVRTDALRRLSGDAAVAAGVAVILAGIDAQAREAVPA